MTILEPNGLIALVGGIIARAVAQAAYVDLRRVAWQRRPPDHATGTTSSARTPDSATRTAAQPALRRPSTIDSDSAVALPTPGQRPNDQPAAVLATAGVAAAKNAAAKAAYSPGPVLPLQRASAARRAKRMANS